VINKQRKKIFYVPGMISLIFIPLLCLGYFFNKEAFTIYGGMDIYFADEKSFVEYKIPVLREYKEFYFNESKSVEKNKLFDLQFFLRKLIKNTDTINGAKVHFGSKTDYDVFVSVIDILNIENVPTWAPYKDDIYILVGSKPTKTKIKNSWVCGTIEATRKNTLRLQEIEMENKNRQFQISFFKSQWILFLGYFGIVLLNIFTLVKFNKNR
jgi:hypothetical protein